MPLSEGTKLGRYEIRAHIVTGGMGQVYLAQDTSELNWLGRFIESSLLAQSALKVERNRARSWTIVVKVHFLHCGRWRT